jgi:predicted transcriptional regulator
MSVERMPALDAIQDTALGLLEDSDEGRVWQGDIVDAADYSPSPVSQALNELEDDGRIERLEIGRQKLVCLDGCLPEVADGR